MHPCTTEKQEERCLVMKWSDIGYWHDSNIFPSAAVHRIANGAVHTNAVGKHKHRLRMAVLIRWKTGKLTYSCHEGSAALGENKEFLGF